MKKFIITIALVLITGCAMKYENQDQANQELVKYIDDKNNVICYTRDRFQRTPLACVVVENPK